MNKRIVCLLLILAALLLPAVSCTDMDAVNGTDESTGETTIDVITGLPETPEEPEKIEYLLGERIEITDTSQEDQFYCPPEMGVLAVFDGIEMPSPENPTHVYKFTGMFDTPAPSEPPVFEGTTMSIYIDTISTDGLVDSEYISRKEDYAYIRDLIAGLEFTDVKPTEHLIRRNGITVRKNGKNETYYFNSPGTVIKIDSDRVSTYATVDREVMMHIAALGALYCRKNVYFYRNIIERDQLPTTGVESYELIVTRGESSVSLDAEEAKAFFDSFFGEDKNEDAFKATFHVNSTDAPELSECVKIEAKWHRSDDNPEFPVVTYITPEGRLYSGVSSYWQYTVQSTEIKDGGEKPYYLVVVGNFMSISDKAYSIDAVNALFAS